MTRAGCLAAVESALGPVRARGRAGIRARQAAALSLRRLGATHAEVAAAVGVGGHQAAMGLARRGEAIEAQDPGFAAVVREATDGAAAGEAAVGRGRRPLAGPRRAPRAEPGRAPVELLGLDLAAIASGLGRGACPADADEAVQAVVVGLWHRGATLPEAPGLAAALIRRWARLRLSKSRAARWRAEAVGGASPDRPCRGGLPDPEFAALALERVAAAGAENHNEWGGQWT